MQSIFYSNIKFQSFNIKQYLRINVKFWKAVLLADKMMMKLQVLITNYHMVT